MILFIQCCIYFQSLYARIVNQYLLNLCLCNIDIFIHICIHLYVCVFVCVFYVSNVVQECNILCACACVCVSNVFLLFRCSFQRALSKLVCVCVCVCMCACTCLQYMTWCNFKNSYIIVLQRSYDSLL